MKLTKEERHIAYIILLTEAESLQLGYVSTFNNIQYPKIGLCHLIYDLFGFVDKVGKITSIIEVIEENFPELEAKRKPKAEREWPEYTIKGWQKRKQLLQQCIAETY